MSYCSVIFYPITVATIPFYRGLLLAALAELEKSIPVHFPILSSHVCFCLFLPFPFTVSCRIVFAESEDLEMWPNHLSLHSMTRVRSSSYSAMAACISLRTYSVVTWPLYVMFLAFGSISSQRLVFFSLTLLSRSMIHRYTEIWK